MLCACRASATASVAAGLPPGLGTCLSRSRRLALSWTHGHGAGPPNLDSRGYIRAYKTTPLRFPQVFIPFTRENEYVKEFKQSPRREDDIAIVNAGAARLAS